MLPPKVATVREARENLSHYLSETRELGVEAPPKFFGAHRHAEAVVLPYERFLQLLDAEENADLSSLVAFRSASRVGTSVSLDEAMETLGVDPDEHDLG